MALCNEVGARSPTALPQACPGFARGLSFAYLETKAGGAEHVSVIHNAPEQPRSGDNVEDSAQKSQRIHFHLLCFVVAEA